jgi:hypothetical protein
MSQKPTHVLALALAAKLLVLGYGFIVAMVVGGEHVASIRDALTVWRHWDVDVYLAIAERGYLVTDQTLAFYPLFPGIVAGAAWLVGDPLVAAFLIATVSSLAASFGLYQLTARDASDRTGRLAVGFFLLYPTSFVLHIPYSESLFMALVLYAFMSARDGRWLLASLLGALAAATRANGLVLLPALAFEAYVRFRDTGSVPRGAFWLVLLPAGTSAYLVANRFVAGDPFYFATVLQQYWGKSLTWPWVGAAVLLKHSVEPSPGQLLWITELCFSVIAILASVVALRAQRASYAVWTVANTLLFVSTGTPISVPRYTLALFPLFLVVSGLGAGSRLAIAVVSTVLLCFLTARFVLGEWAF